MTESLGERPASAQLDTRKQHRGVNPPQPVKSRVLIYSSQEREYFEYFHAGRRRRRWR